MSTVHTTSVCPTLPSGSDAVMRKVCSPFFTPVTVNLPFEQSRERPPSSRHVIGPSTASEATKRMSASRDEVGLTGRSAVTNAGPMVSICTSHSAGGALHTWVCGSRALTSKLQRPSASPE